MNKVFSRWRAAMQPLHQREALIHSYVTKLEVKPKNIKIKKNPLTCHPVTFQVSFASFTFFYELFTRWMRELKPKNSESVPSAAEYQVSIRRRLKPRVQLWVQI